MANTYRQLYDINDVIRCNKEHGYHFFDDNIMRGFNSKLYPETFQWDKFVIFCTSEKKSRFLFIHDDCSRKYTVRVIDVTSGSLGRHVYETMQEVAGFPKEWLSRFNNEYYSSRNGQVSFYCQLVKFLKAKQNEK